ncbi:MAG: M48 family metalloprotease, partial [Acidobacteria bacterium]|nr:M48 family metalloprotease [Acidobacteriota bacterium]
MNEDKAARYHRLRRRTAVCAAAWSVLLLAGLLVSGGSHALRDLAARAAAHAPWPGALSYPLTVAIWALVVALIHELGTLPFAFFGGFVLDRRYELSRQTAGEWLRDHLKALGLGLLLGVAAAVGIYVAMACWPVGWWVAAWIGALAAGVAMTWAAPVFLLPLFFTLKPLGQETLKRRLLALAARMGAPAIGIFEWRLSDRTSRANALLTGMGSTRRILLSDTLVVDYDEDEIEVVLAHELAHHVRHDVWRGLALQGLVA